MDEMQKVILEYVENEYLEDDDEEINVDTPLISGGIVDSFSMVSLKRFLETKYKISIPDEDATPEAFNTVNKICTSVKEFISRWDLSNQNLLGMIVFTMLVSIH